MVKSTIPANRESRSLAVIARKKRRPFATRKSIFRSGDIGPRDEEARDFSQIASRALSAKFFKYRQVLGFFSVHLLFANLISRFVRKRKCFKLEFLKKKENVSSKVNIAQNIYILICLSHLKCFLEERDSRTVS